jgi:dTDP-4-amino-4,6-dideoxygalactose transaminase
MAVPFLDLKSIYNEIRDEVTPEINDVLESCGYVLGPKVMAFEKDFAAICGTSYCIGVSSGTAALHCMIAASELPTGSGIIVPPNTFTATVEGIILAGMVPVFVDVESQTWNLDPEEVASFIERNRKSEGITDPRTGAEVRAVMAVDLYGQPADYPALESLAEKHGLMLFEDAAQSHDAHRSHRPAGSFGIAASFSFYPGKNMGAFGEGGAITTSDESLYRKALSLRDHGSREKYFYDHIGHNYRMCAIQGAVLGVKARHIHRWNDQRREAALRYGQMLGGLPLRLPAESPDSRHVWHLYPIHTPERNDLMVFLREKGIASGLHYPHPLHLQKAYAYLGHSNGDFPNSERNSLENLTLPMFPGITPEQQQEVADAIKAFFEA